MLGARNWSTVARGCVAVKSSAVNFRGVFDIQMKLEMNDREAGKISHAPRGTRLSAMRKNK